MSYFELIFIKYFRHCIHLARSWIIHVECTVMFLRHGKPQYTVGLSYYHRSLLQRIVNINSLFCYMTYLLSAYIQIPTQ